MIQAIIINEKDLSTTQSCSHNCDLELIGDTVNNTDCQQFRDCRYFAHNIDICKMVNRYSYLHMGMLVGSTDLRYT